MAVIIHELIIRVRVRDKSEDLTKQQQEEPQLAYHTQQQLAEEMSHLLKRLQER